MYCIIQNLNLIWEKKYMFVVFFKENVSEL